MRKKLAAALDAYCHNDDRYAEFSEEEEKIIEEMREILSHEAFLHEGWATYRFYRTDACGFILKLIRGDYDEVKQ
jgi:hypothetical protein